MTTPVVSNYFNSGDNTATSSWGITLPAQSVGDLIIVNLVWDDSTDTTSHTRPAGPNGETIVDLVIAHTGGAAEQRISVFYWIATASVASGTYTVVPNAAEQWTATVVKVAAGDFDADDPIGTTATGGSATDSTTVSSPAITAGPTDGGSRLCAWLGIDVSPVTATPSGWTDHTNVDRGAIVGVFSSRDNAVTNNQSISAANWTISLANTSATFAYIVREAPALALATSLLIDSVRGTVTANAQIEGTWAINGVTT